MKLPTQSRKQAPRGRRGFTLVELMVSMALFTMVIGGVVYGHITGLTMYELTKAKLGANDETRTALGLLSSEIRAAKSVAIGNVSNLTFTAIADGDPQQGPALRIRQTTNASSHITYFLDTSDNALKRFTESSTTPVLIAANITNAVIFSSEDYAGNVLSANSNNRVIGVTLQFYQIQYPVVRIGDGELFDFYQLRTRITRRALE
ncbi:MAG: prepilin-type N-terminal cleavage/methylation domain-containing protein [Pedosphaera parvula]|nr:prepilin-type N-terminal cleavage/methylation domain-containing protein [Pedosphaera parvula]